MHQLLIVDDQPDLVDDLAEMMPWDSVGIVKVHKAYSAREALDIVAVHPVDIVVTDIRMPGMSGLELVERIRDSWKNIRCILLSGHDNFEYVKRALQHQANDYLLKPVEDKELLGSVAKAVQDLEAQWSDIASFRNALQSVKNNLPILRDHLLTDLLEGRRLDRQDMADKLELLEIPFRVDHPCCMMLLRLEDSFRPFTGKDRSLLEFAVTNIAQDIFADEFRLWQTKDAYHYLVFLVHRNPDLPPVDRESREQVESKAVQLQHYMKLYLKGTASVLISNWGVFPDDISGLYNASVIHFRRHIGSDKELLLSIADEAVPLRTHSLTRLHEPPMLVHLLEAGQWAALNEKLDDIFDELEQQWGHSHEHILEAYLAIASAVCFSAHNNKRWMAELLGDDYLNIVNGSPFHTIQQLRIWTERVLHKYRSDMETESKDSRSNLVRQVQEYIHGHLGEASLQSIASHVHLNPSYLSKIYKLEAGEGISDYVFRLKIDQAAYKLRTSGDKIYEIAASLGYSKTSYFIKVFKEKYGLTPQEYRDKLS